MNYDPTDEQQAAIDLFSSGKNLAIEAGAGTGKTSTLQFIAESTRKKGQYLAFNKAIVTDSSEKMPANIACKTAHSLAYGKIIGRNKGMKDRLNAPRQKLEEVSKILGLSSFSASTEAGGDKILSDNRIAAIVNNTVYNFCCSADREISYRHVPFIDAIDDPGSYINNNLLSRYVAPYAEKVWEDVSQESGAFQFKHEHYLKLYQLSNPRISADFIMFDEAQDANPVMLDIVAQQDHAQVVFVGDSNQQIYEFTGAVNAMSQIPSDNKTFLTKSFRFGEAVAHAANAVLELLDTEMRLVGFEKIDSRLDFVESPDAILVRTNAGAITSIISQLMTGKKVGYVGNVDEIIKFMNACQDLMSGRKTMHPELMCFDSWDELVLYAELAEDKGLQLMIRLIKQYTAPKIISSFKQLTAEKNADVVISTAHKAKGREWKKVYIADDFADEIESSGDSEKRLMYVALTRAQEVLDAYNVSIFRTIYDEILNGRNQT